MRSETFARRDRRRPHVPGEPELWMLILGDLTVFAVFFGIWAWQRAAQPALFAAGRDTLDTTLGLTNTLILITSSMAVACGLDHLRTGEPQRAARAYLAAAALGAGFVAVKTVEYHQHLAAGQTPATGDFFMYYFVFTGIHLLHVLAGLAGLVLLSRRCRSREPSRVLFEGVGVYWHMVDVIWIVLFYLVYLA
ncbi:cytochrome c oxidase subunit 3 [Nocardia amamiensis]|uniref:cytochrome c oxidase subunit 3 n=1 Tax=Nocardia amamiensis TaxID=404578 RepID=UPI0034078383